MAEEKSSTKLQTFDPKKYKILIVEDEKSIREVMHAALVEHGFQTQVAPSAIDAFQIIKEFQPHLVLTDHDMPECTGLEMLKELRKQENYVTLIFVTGRTENHLVVEAFRSGADDYIKKPFRINEFIARVEASLRVNDLHRALLEANHRLQEMIDHDYLTGLYNMRSIYERIDYELKRAKRFHRSIVAVMLDMDDFKKVNDSNDHLFGSFVIKEMGQLIQQCAREVDLAARYGGDEFLVVLLEADEAGARIFCERLRALVEKHLFIEGTNSIKLTVSMGYCVGSNQDGLNARDLVRQADRALYEAKAQGKNRFVGSTFKTAGP